MKILLALTTLAALCQLHWAFYKRTTTRSVYQRPDDDEAIYEAMLKKTWYNPHPALRKLINLTIPEYDEWTSLGKFVPTGKKLQTTGITRFCKCKNPYYPGKRSLVTPVKRTKVKRDGSSSGMVLRQEWRRMSSTKKKAFIKHFNNLATKQTGEDMSRLELFANWHRRSESPGAHGGPAFLPWHREYLFRLENYLRDDGYEYGLPYWNSGLDYPLPVAADSAIFTTSELGISRGQLGEPFEMDPVSSACIESNLPENVIREASDNNNLLFHEEKKKSLPWEEDYEEFSRRLEGRHGGVHRFIGGHMARFSCTGFEPLFYMHHAYIDCIWQEYRNTQSVFDQENDYPTHANVDFDHRKFRTMKPFNELESIDGLQIQYTNVYYRYQESPNECKKNKHCKSDLLWCNRPRCQAKIQEGGACDTDLSKAQCYCKNGNPACSGGTCRCN